MRRFMLNVSELSELSRYAETSDNAHVKPAYASCPCGNNGCTGSAQYGCSACSSCSDWAHGKGV